MTFNSYYSGIKNKYLYNGGTERQEDIDLDLTNFRSYDPAIGRFNQIDPLAGMFSSLSPYHYAYNNPAVWNDPWGLAPVERDGDTYIINWNEVGENGGRWTEPQDGGGGWEPFESGQDALNWGIEYNNTFGSWGSMASIGGAGSESAARANFRNMSGCSTCGLSAKLKTSTSPNRAVWINKNNVGDDTKVNPIIYVDLFATKAPEGFELNHYKDELKDALLSQGFSSQLQVRDYSLLAHLASFLTGDTYATVTLRMIRPNDKLRGRVGHAKPFSNSANVSLLSTRKTTAYYVWTTIHELGHAIFGFQDRDDENEKNNLMYYTTLNIENRRFDTAQLGVIKRSIWGN